MKGRRVCCSVNVWVGRFVVVFFYGVIVASGSICFRCFCDAIHSIVFICSIIFWKSSLFLFYLPYASVFAQIFILKQRIIFFVVVPVGYSDNQNVEENVDLNAFI